MGDGDSTVGPGVTSTEEGGLDESGRGASTAERASSDGSTAQLSVTGQGSTGADACAPDEITCVHGGCGEVVDDCCAGSAPGDACEAEVACESLSALRIHAGPDGALCADAVPSFQCAPLIACPYTVACDPADPDAWWSVADCGGLGDGFIPCRLPGGVDPFAVPAC